MAIELTELEKKQKELNRKLFNPKLSKKDLPLKIKYRVKGKDNDSFFSLIPYSFMKEANDKGISVKDLNPKKRQLKNGDVFEVVDVSPFKSTLFITKEGLGIDKTKFTWFDLIEEKPALETKASNSTKTSNASLEQDLNNSDLGKTARKIQIGFSVVGWGVFGILAYKFWNKSTTWKVILSVFGAYNLYSTYKVFSKPALQVEGGSNTGTSTGKETSTGSSTSTSTNTATIPDYSNLNKYQKIDLIIQNQSGGEPMDADEINSTTSFLNTLTDAELTIWIPLSKALKDSEVSKAGESGDKQKLYSLLQSKYGLTQQQVDEQMKKFGEFLMGSIQTAMGDSQFTGKNDMFSNFESSLNLDL